MKQIKPRTRLIERRKELKKTQQTVADEAKITRAFYTNIERGEKDPSLEVAEKISNSLNATINELFCDCIVPERNTMSPTGTVSC